MFSVARMRSMWHHWVRREVSRICYGYSNTWAVWRRRGRHVRGLTSRVHLRLRLSEPAGAFHEAKQASFSEAGDVCFIKEVLTSLPMKIGTLQLWLCICTRLSRYWLWSTFPFRVCFSSCVNLEQSWFKSLVLTFPVLFWNSVLMCHILLFISSLCLCFPPSWLSTITDSGENGSYFMDKMFSVFPLCLNSLRFMQFPESST